MSEVWKDIPGYEGRYQASTEGRIRSVNRLVTQRAKNGTPYVRKVKARILPGSTRGDGYILVSLGHAKPHYAHVLVALTFLGERPQDADVCHNDGNPSNNKITNLRYDSRSENIIDACRAGTHNLEKLTAEQVHLLRGLAASGATCKDLGLRFGISATTACNAKNRRTYAWVE